MTTPRLEPDPFRAAEILARSHGLLELAAEIRVARGSSPIVDRETEARIEQLLLDYRLAFRWDEAGSVGKAATLRRSVEVLRCLLTQLRGEEGAPA